MRCVFLFLALIQTGCSVLVPSQTAPQNGTAVVRSKSAVDCENLEALDVAVVVEPGPAVRVTYDGVLIKDIEVPNDVGGFLLDQAKKTSAGFEISIQYGSRYYSDKRLTFECRPDGLYLTKVKIESFDRSNPDKWTNKTVSVRPPVSLQNFRIQDHTRNP